jgi:DNA-directed RNA polymerase subunit beta'
MSVFSSYFNVTDDLNAFNKIRISLASPETILSWSFGEVSRPDTINYRTTKPEPRGLFCARIFGPVQDYECLCGKYKRMKHRGIVCEKCGVEVTTSKVRRERMGHIQLAAPVVHPWFISRICTLLDMAIKSIDKVLQFELYIVYEPGVSNFKNNQLISEDEYHDAKYELGDDAFDAGTGAEGIRKILSNIDLDAERTLLRTELSNTSSEIKRKKIVKRLKLIEGFIESHNRPEWMVLEVMPVIPPDIRPLVMLDGGRFATSDLNELYRRVINRNNRLKKLIDLKAPDIIVRNEKRMLQESVDACFDNGRKSKAVRASNKRPYKALADMLKGKQGRFRQNLLGKRVDYSGRSVIVVGPELKLHQCGLPKSMAMELFKPFVLARLEMTGAAATLRSAHKMITSKRPEALHALEHVVREHPVLLNRAPTLHRLGIQAFEPILIEGQAIQLHPLVCAAFNADFDGDQMAVHIPLSIEAQLEARVLMMSTNNILSPANGKPIIVPSQDIIFGLYYLSLELPNQLGEGMFFSGISEVEHALNNKKVSLHAKIKCRCKVTGVDGQVMEYLLDTTPGRVLISELLPQDGRISFDQINKVLNKKEVSNLIYIVYRLCGQKSTVIFADKIMQLGFRYACKAGLSIGKDDMVIPPTKDKYINEAMHEVQQYDMQYAEGLITSGEKYNKTVDTWSRCTDKIGNDAMKIISGQKLDTGDSIGHTLNSIFMMADSGARGSAAQIKQLVGMRGLMTKPSGEIIENPIKSNFKEGLTVLEYFTSTHGARKGLSDTALKTANSGYLTRKLVDVAQDCVIIENDCGSTEGIIARPVIESGEITTALGEVILGRVSAKDIFHPITNKLMISAGDMIGEREVEMIDEAGIDAIEIRSVLTCKTKKGVCAKCYGRDLATGEWVNLGEAVGIIAAQSIGEPGTQLTMRTFHIGGAAQKTSTQSSAIASHSGQVKFSHKNTVFDSKSRQIVMSRNCEAMIYDNHGYEKARYKIPYGSRLLFEDGDKVEATQKLAEWDPFTVPIITEKTGIAKFIDLVDRISMHEIQDDITGVINRIVIDGKSVGKGNNDLRPRIALYDEKGNILTLANGLEARYFLPVDAILSVADGQEVQAGDILARIPKESSKNKDIIGGLPRVVDLFEARQPKDHSVISESDGMVEFGKDYKSKRRIIVRNPENSEEFTEYFVPRGRHITVTEGDFVKKGDMLMEGNPSPHDILQVMGIEALANYIVREVQQVYKLQGETINDKHIEIIVKQMLRKIEIVHPGGTTFLAGEQVDKSEFEAVNEKTVKLGYEPAIGKNILQGITRASLQTQSFFSAASFQDTTKVLIEAALEGKQDELHGLKESIIVGKLIPAGTGFHKSKIKKEAESF